MPKLEVNASGGFLLNGKPKRLAYDVSESGSASDPTITFTELGSNRVTLVSAPLSEWTDNADASFANIGDFYTYLSDTVGFFLSASVNGASSTEGVLAQFNLEFDLSTSSALAVKKVKYNNADPASVTDIYMSETSFNDKDLSQYISRLKTDDILIMQQSDDAATFTTYTVIGDPTEDSGMWTIPVLIGNDVGTLPANQKEVSMDFVYFSATEAQIQSSSSALLVNGNLSINEFDSVRNFNNNTTEYYGVELILQTGVYTTVEIPYKNRVSTTDPSYLYAIILDQNNTTLAYKRLYVGLNAITEGSFIIEFDAPITISTSGIYQLVIGRRKWNQTTKRCDIFAKSINSSSGGIWVAFTGSNASLANDDTSAVDWSTITKQNFNVIPKTLIYKF